MYVYYIVQRFNAFSITATFDVRSISVDGPVIRGRVCLTVEYVDGHEQPPRTFVLFKCTTRESYSQAIIIDGTVQCTQLPPHTSYDIIATDYDASDDINTTAAVTILGVAVPDYTIAPSSITRTTTPTGTVTHHTCSEKFDLYCYFLSCIRVHYHTGTNNCTSPVTGGGSSCSTCVW